MSAPTEHKNVRDVFNDKLIMDFVSTRITAGKTYASICNKEFFLKHIYNSALVKIKFQL